MKEKTVNIFVYGTLKKGYSAHNNFCGNATRIIPYTIKGTLFDTKMGFPAAQLKGNHQIHGQIITVPQNQLQNFDYYESVPIFYQRSQIQVVIAGKKQKAYIYTMRVLPFGASIVPNGNW